MEQNNPKSTAPEPEQRMEDQPPAEEGQDIKMDMNEAPDLMSRSPGIASAPMLSAAISKARNTILGSGQLKPEIMRAGEDCINLPVDTASGILKTLKNIVTLHPVEAVKSAASGAAKVTGGMIDFVTSPTRLAVAGTYATGRGIKAVAKAPFQGAAWIAKSPFKVWGLINNGLEKFHQFSTKLAK